MPCVGSLEVAVRANHLLIITLICRHFNYRPDSDHERSRVLMSVRRPWGSSPEVRKRHHEDSDYGYDFPQEPEFQQIRRANHRVRIRTDHQDACWLELFFHRTTPNNRSRTRFQNYLVLTFRCQGVPVSSIKEQ